MEVTPQTVMMLVLDTGNCPIEEWLSGLRDKVTRARITRQIDKLGRGLFGDRRGVGDGVAELKLDFGPGYRVYYAHIGNITVVLLGGGDKSEQSKDIERAQELWREFEENGLPEVSLVSWSKEQREPPDDKDTKL